MKEREKEQREERDAERRRKQEEKENEKQVRLAERQLKLQKAQEEREAKREMEKQRRQTKQAEKEEKKKAIESQKEESIMKGKKIDHTSQNCDASLVAHVHDSVYTRQVEKNPKALRVDLMFTVESPKSVSCDAMTNVGSCLGENS